jgi:hypothetical protein
MSSIAKKRADYHEFLLILPDGAEHEPTHTPGRRPCTDWTPRRHLVRAIPMLLQRGWWRLAWRAVVAVIWRDNHAQNLVVDAVIVAVESV